MLQKRPAFHEDHFVNTAQIGSWFGWNNRHSSHPAAPDTASTSGELLPHRSTPSPHPAEREWHH
ncbi:MAG: hypothetical protein DWI00_04990 [Planctomycetota bacterium]|nr:MAG: hypothetical protein DWI00_04990 [Planctomycetota bacterium]